MVNHILLQIIKFLSHQVSFSDCIEGRKCAYFSGESYLSVNNLTNSFHTWKTFTIDLWHKPSHLVTVGLLTNGLASTGCCSSPTVSITTTNRQLNSCVALKDRAAQLKGRVCKRLHFNQSVLHCFTYFIPWKG